MNEEDFSRECAAILGADDLYRARTFARRTRWNNRDPGNGRFPGFGTIRMFAPHSAEEALALLRELCASGG